MERGCCSLVFVASVVGATIGCRMGEGSRSLIFVCEAPACKTTARPIKAELLGGSVVIREIKEFKECRKFCLLLSLNSLSSLNSLKAMARYYF